MCSKNALIDRCFLEAEPGVAPGIFCHIARISGRRVASRCVETSTTRAGDFLLWRGRREGVLPACTLLHNLEQEDRHLGSGIHE